MRNIFLFGAALSMLFASCSLLVPIGPGGPTKRVKGQLYELEVMDSPKPYGYSAMAAPENLKEVDLDTASWRLESYSARISSDQGSVSYSFVNESKNQYFQTISKREVTGVQIIKAGTKGCKVKNYKVTTQTQSTRTPVAVAFILDHSGSMGQYRAEIMQAYLDSALAFKHPDDEVCIIKFDNFVQKSPLTRDLVTLRREVRPSYGLYGFGRATAIQDAISDGVELLKMSTLKDKQIVIITDGRENSSSRQRNLEALIQEARRSKIAINAIAFGQYVDVPYLQGICTNSGGYFDQFYGTEEFTNVFKHVYNRINNNVKISFTPCLFGDSIIVKTTFNIDGKQYNHEKMYFNEIGVGESIELSVLFDKEKSTIKSEFESELIDFVAFLNANPTVQVELGGHTDSDGDAAYNQKLSESRAKAIKDFLVKQGVDKDRLSVIGYGESQPKYPNDSPDNMYLNRRTEAKIIKF
jgi:Mg-chelatase subunit ChlD